MVLRDQLVVAACKYLLYFTDNIYKGFYCERDVTIRDCDMSITIVVRSRIHARMSGEKTCKLESARCTINRYGAVYPART